MNIVKQSDGRSFFTAGAVTLPLMPGTLNDLLAHAKLLSRVQLEEVVKDAGLESHPNVEDRSVFLVAVSFAQNAWYEDVVTRLQAGETLPSTIPPNLSTLDGRKGEEKDGALIGQAYALTRHAERLAAFRIQVERARENAARTRRPLGPQGSEEHKAELRAKLPQLPTPKVAPQPIEGHTDLVAITLEGDVVHLTQDGSVWYDAVDTPKEEVAEAILAAAGYDVPAGLSLDVMEPVVKGVVRRWWYETSKQPVPDDLTYEQQLLYKRYLLQVKHPPKKAKEPKPAREPKPTAVKSPTNAESNAPGGSPAPSRPRQAKDVRFAVVTAYDGRGQTKFIYDAIVHVTTASEPAASLSVIVTKAEELGFATKEPGGSTPRVRWLALELVKKGILKVVE